MGDFKLALIINVFEGEEHLPKVLRIRPNVDYCIAVTQKVSYNGEYYDRGHEVASREKLIDKIVEFVPQLHLKPRINERLKRNMGIQEAIKQGCTHFIECDSDEVYSPIQFETAKKHLYENDYDSSFCRHINYYYSNEYLMNPPLTFYVPFIHKLTKETIIGVDFHTIEMDETRRISPIGKMKVFDEKELIMHHYTLVRENIGRKLRNSSAQFKDVPSLVNDFNSFPKKVILCESVKKIV